MTQSNQLNRYLHIDANSDKGYGRIQAKFHTPRSFLQYPEPPTEDPEAAESIDDETYTAVLKKLLNYEPADEYAKNSTDPFYYVGAATKLSETTAKGMVPFPRMYANKQSVSGGTSPRSPGGPTLAFRTRIRPTGTKKGFSQAPYPEPGALDNKEIRSYNDIFSVDHDEEHVNLIQKLVNLIHLEQQREKINSPRDIYK